jgi:hypothetical protein
MDYRIPLQFISWLVALFTLALLCYYKIKYGKIRPILSILISLVIHLFVFYTFVLLWSADVFSIMDFLNELVDRDLFSFTLWSSTLRLHTSIGLAMIVLWSLRRESWVRKKLSS